MSAFKVMKGCRRGWGLFIDLLSKNTTAHPWKQKKKQGLCHEDLTVWVLQNTTLKYEATTSKYYGLFLKAPTLITVSNLNSGAGSDCGKVRDLSTC